MVIAATILIAGLLGVIGHWYTRWAQGRTDTPFKDYLLVNKASTLSSVFANVSSSMGIYTALPDDAAAKMIVIAVYAAYTAGYALDSTLNRDPQGSQPAQPSPATAHEAPTPKKTLQEIKHENAEKPLQDLLDRDSAL